MKLKVVLFTFLFLLLAIIVFRSYKTIKSRKFSKSTFVEECSRSNNDRFDIGIIGDSWVMPQMIDIGLQSKLSEIENLNVSSFGQGGARSKKIFENLLLPEGDRFSSGSILNGSYDAVVIVAGVNDVTNYSGKDFYSFHIMKIVTQLVKCEILPIIVTIPEFDVEDCFAVKPWYKRFFIDTPNRILFNENISDLREKYNEALKEQLEASGMKYLLIEFEEFIDDYHSSINLYSNRAHLNREGYIKFGEFIGSEIMDNLDFVRANTHDIMVLSEN